MQTAFPTPEDDDAEDVAWGLTTGAALWRQGERYDAIVWLKRAVEAANDAGAPGPWTQVAAQAWNASAIPLASVMFELKGGTWRLEATNPGTVIFDNFKAAKP